MALTHTGRDCSREHLVKTIIYLCNQAAEVFNTVRCGMWNKTCTSPTSRNLSKGIPVQLLLARGAPQVWARSIKMMDKACISHLADVAKWDFSKTKLAVVPVWASRTFPCSGGNFGLFFSLYRTICAISVLLLSFLMFTELILLSLLSYWKLGFECQQNIAV